MSCEGIRGCASYYAGLIYDTFINSVTGSAEQSAAGCSSTPAETSGNSNNAVLHQENVAIIIRNQLNLDNNVSAPECRVSGLQDSNPQDFYLEAADQLLAQYAPVSQDQPLNAGQRELARTWLAISLAGYEIDDYTEATTRLDERLAEAQNVLSRTSDANNPRDLFSTNMEQINTYCSNRENSLAVSLNFPDIELNITRQQIQEILTAVRAVEPAECSTTPIPQFGIEGLYTVNPQGAMTPLTSLRIDAPAVEAQLRGTSVNWLEDGATSLPTNLEFSFGNGITVARSGSNPVLVDNGDGLFSCIIPVTLTVTATSPVPAGNRNFVVQLTGGQSSTVLGQRSMSFEIEAARNIIVTRNNGNDVVAERDCNPNSPGYSGVCSCATDPFVRASRGCDD